MALRLSSQSRAIARVAKAGRDARVVSTSSTSALRRGPRQSRVLTSDEFGWRRASRLAGRACASRAIASLSPWALRKTSAEVSPGGCCVVPRSPHGQRFLNRRPAGLAPMLHSACVQPRPEARYTALRSGFRPPLQAPSTSAGSAFPVAAGVSVHTVRAATSSKSGFAALRSVNQPRLPCFNSPRKAGNNRQASRIRLFPLAFPPPSIPGYR
ncbi:hypothetical protein FHS79_001313 [Polymorphobacter multimanifer]|uniref:Uncharacterized protein n=1 Tax=Polymorphobacter multimanifer TaxID=1070431 RepID=A0A841L2U5_9SPHN|nr:hypothetical protein [Polymorphobacter multimanifer]